MGMTPMGVAFYGIPLPLTGEHYMDTVDLEDFFGTEDHGVDILMLGFEDEPRYAICVAESFTFAEWSDVADVNLGGVLPSHAENVRNLYMHFRRLHIEEYPDEEDVFPPPPDLKWCVGCSYW
jgi:hypothetical protein